MHRKRSYRSKMYNNNIALVFRDTIFDAVPSHILQQFKFQPVVQTYAVTTMLTQSVEQLQFCPLLILRRPGIR